MIVFMRRYVLIILCNLFLSGIHAQKYSISSVQELTNRIENWVVSDRYKDRKAIENLCKRGMRISDDLAKQLAKRNDAVPMETYELADYLNWIQNEMDKRPKNFKISFSNYRRIPEEKWPSNTKGFELYACTVNTYGTLNYSCEDLILVKKGVIYGIAPYKEDKNHKVHIDFDDFINDYETVGFSYNYGKHFPVGGSLNYSFEEIPFMLSVDFGINLDGDKYIIDKVEMQDILNYTREKKVVDPKFFLTLTPQVYFKYFAIGCGVGFLYMDGTEETANYAYTSSTTSSGNVSVTVSGSGSQSVADNYIMLKPMIRPVAKGFIPLSDEFWISLSVGYDLIFGYKEKNGLSFGLGIQWEL